MYVRTARIRDDDVGEESINATIHKITKREGKEPASASFFRTHESTGVVLVCAFKGKPK